MKRLLMISALAAALLLSGCGAGMTGMGSRYSGRESSDSRTTSSFSQENDESRSDFTSAYTSADSGIEIPDAAYYLNTTGVLSEDLYSIGDEGTYYCTVYELPAGEGGSEDIIAYQFSANAAGYDWERVQGDEYNEYVMTGNGISAYLDVYSDAWVLYYPVGSCLVSNSGSGNSERSSDSFQNDSFGITVKPGEGSDLPEGVCVFCEGKKVCRFCNGSGQQYVDVITGWVDCDMCIDGSCPHCNGTGIDSDF